MFRVAPQHAHTAAAADSSAVMCSRWTHTESHDQHTTGSTLTPHHKARSPALSISLLLVQPGIFWVLPSCHIYRLVAKRWNCNQEMPGSVRREEERGSDWLNGQEGVEPEEQQRKRSRSLPFTSFSPLPTPSSIFPSSPPTSRAPPPPHSPFACPSLPSSCPSFFSSSPSCRPPLPIPSSPPMSPDAHRAPFLLSSSFSSSSSSVTSPHQPCYSSSTSVLLRLVILLILFCLLPPTNSAPPPLLHSSSSSYSVSSSSSPHPTSPLFSLLPKLLSLLPLLLHQFRSHPPPPFTWRAPC